MSHILFGSCIIQNEHFEEMDRVKQYMSKYGINIWIDKEIDFYNDVHIIIAEYNKEKYNHVFCLTSKNQLTNSDDLLFPYDKYTNEELFPNGEDRTTFNKYCEKNLLELGNCLIYFKDVIAPHNLRIFLTEGYNNLFKIIYGNIDDMINDVLEQVKQTHFLDSSIYFIE